MRKSLEGNDDKIDWSKVKDLYDDEEMMQEMVKEGFQVDDADKPKLEKTDNKRTRKLR